MNTLYWLITITNRHSTDAFLALYEEHGITVSLRTVGAGTAVRETLSTLGLEQTEKAVLFAMITAETWPGLQKDLRRKMRIDVPGTGIAFIIPVSSIGGKRALQFLTEHQTLALKEESTLKDTRYELLLVIANQGHTGSIMDAARAAGAGGGTVIHAKGTGMEGAAHFMGVELVNEKELVLIVSRTTLKNQIMQAIMQGAGPKAGAIVFSLPVTDTAGLRETDESVEEMGVALSRQKVRQADAILLLVDGGRLGPAGAAADICPDEAVREVLEQAGDIPVLLVWNKVDLAEPAVWPPVWGHGRPCVRISASTGHNVDTLARRLRALLLDDGSHTPPSDGLAPNARQSLVLERALHELDALLADIAAGSPYDCCSVRLDAAAALLGEVTGLDSPEEVLNRVFSSFCIGK